MISYWSIDTSVRPLDEPAICHWKSFPNQLFLTDGTDIVIANVLLPDRTVIFRGRWGTGHLVRMLEQL